MGGCSDRRTHPGGRAEGAGGTTERRPVKSEDAGVVARTPASHIAALERIRAVLNQGPHAYMLCEIQEAVDSVLGEFSYFVGKPCP